MAHAIQSPNDRRKHPRAEAEVAVRVVPLSHTDRVIDGVTIDVSSNGVGIKVLPQQAAQVDSVLEMLVEERAPVEVTLRLPQGSVSAEGQVIWWGLLDDDEGFSIRGGLLLPDGWSDSDWKLIRECFKLD